MFAEPITESNSINLPQDVRAGANIGSDLQSSAGGIVSILDAISLTLEREVCASGLDFVTVFDPPIKIAAITDLYEEGYKLLRPIPTELERVGESEVIAKFKEANIAIAGVSEQDAFQSVFADILDTFDALSDEGNNLGPDAAKQLQVLRTYIAKA